MIKRLLWPSLFCLNSGLFAATGPTLVREYRSGFVPAALMRSDVCEVSAESTRIVRTLRGVTSTETRAMAISDAEALLLEANQGKITIESGAVDIPTFIYYGLLEMAKGEVLRVDIFEENGETGQVKFNDSEAAIVLRQLLDLHCS